MTVDDGGVDVEPAEGSAYANVRQIMRHLAVILAELLVELLVEFENGILIKLVQHQHLVHEVFQLLALYLVLIDLLKCRLRGNSL